jgi:hypothetical protein
MALFLPKSQQTKILLEGKNHMKRFLSLLLAVVFLAGNIGVTVANHYCGDEIYNQAVSLGHADLNCGMEKSERQTCESPNDFFSKSCCQTEFHNYKISDEFQSELNESKIDIKFSIAIFRAFYPSLTIEKDHPAEYFNYYPPLLERDIPVLIQSFLI